MAFPIPVTVLTGFLGAGKTTLVNRLLKDPALTDTAVIVNEFGDVAIDHLLVEQSSDGIIEMAGGCLCCTVRGALADTLADLAARVETAGLPLRRVIIETTGLADPVPVLHAIMAHPLLVQAFSLDGVVAVVDAVHGTATLDAHPEAVRQAAVADRLVVSKADMAEAAAGLDDLRERLRRLNPTAAVVTSAEAGYAALFNCGLYDPATKNADVPRWLNDEALHEAQAGRDGTHRHGEKSPDAPEHAHSHRHDARVSSFSLVDDRPLSLAGLEMFLDLLLSTHGHRLLRLKGIVETTDDPGRPLVIHAVQQILHPPARLAAWPDGRRGVRLVLIGFDVGEAYVRDLFAAFADRPAVDRPDRAALAANPLAIPG